MSDAPVYSRMLSLRSLMTRQNLPGSERTCSARFSGIRALGGYRRRSDWLNGFGFRVCKNVFKISFGCPRTIAEVPIVDPGAFFL